MELITAKDIERLLEQIQLREEPLTAIVVPDDQIEEFKIDIQNALPPTTNRGPFDTFAGIPVIPESEFFARFFVNKDLKPSDEDMRRIMLDQVRRVYQGIA